MSRGEGTPGREPGAGGPGVGSGAPWEAAAPRPERRRPELQGSDPAPRTGPGSRAGEGRGADLHGPGRPRPLHSRPCAPPRGGRAGTEQPAGCAPSGAPGRGGARLAEAGTRRPGKLRCGSPWAQAWHCGRRDGLLSGGVSTRSLVKRCGSKTSAEIQPPTHPEGPTDAAPQLPTPALQPGVRTAATVPPGLSRPGSPHTHQGPCRKMGVAPDSGPQHGVSEEQGAPYPPR